MRRESRDPIFTWSHWKRGSSRTGTSISSSWTRKRPRRAGTCQRCLHAEYQTKILLIFNCIVMAHSKVTSDLCTRTITVLLIQVEVLYERCMIACALYEEFWMNYAGWFQKRGAEYNDKVRSVYERACNHHLPNKVAELLLAKLPLTH